VLAEHPQGQLQKQQNNTKQSTPKTTHKWYPTDKAEQEQVTSGNKKHY
jgi:hypothetical protein